jgi:hypothetical protein
LGPFVSSETSSEIPLRMSIRVGRFFLVSDKTNFYFNGKLKNRTP